jgi:hypothetical protein
MASTTNNAMDAPIPCNHCVRLYNVDEDNTGGMIGMLTRKNTLRTTSR